MNEDLVMVADLGTSLVKAGVYDMGGSCVARAAEAVKSEAPAPGLFIQRGEDIVGSVLRCLKNCADAAGDRVRNVRALAFTGQMAGFMGVGDGWEDVTGWSCSIDTRYAPYAARQMEEYAGDMLAISGTNSPLFSAKYVWFSAEFPQQAERIRKYVMLSGYVAGRLGGMPLEDAAIDASLLTWTGLADVKGRRWSEKICGELGVPRDRLPRVVSSHSVIARLSDGAARLAGLPSGIPIVAGAGDKVAGCVGAGNLERGAMLFEAASFGAVSCMVDAFRPDEEKRGFDIINGASEGELYAHYYMPGSGITQDWFIDGFFRREGEDRAEAYRRMESAIASIPPGSEGVFAVGMLGGTVMPFDGDLRGAFLGHSWSHRPEHFYRALAESFACALSAAIDRIDALYPEYRERDSIRVIGGGAKSPETLRIYASVTGKAMETIDRDDAALWGAAILGAKGVGLVDDIAAFSRSHAAGASRIEPDGSAAEAYSRIKDQYIRYSRVLSQLCRDRVNK